MNKKIVRFLGVAFFTLFCSMNVQAAGSEKEISLSDLQDKSVNLQNLNPARLTGSSYDDRERQTLITGYFVTSYRYNDNGVSHGHGNEMHFGQDSAETRNFGFDAFNLGFTKRFSDYLWVASSLEVGMHDGAAETNLHIGEVHLVAPVGNGIDFTVGKFLSPVSFEKEDAPFQLQASNSLTYQFASPAEMTGLMVTYPFFENVNVKGIVFNGWNQNADNNKAKSLAFQVEYAPKRWLTTKLSYLWGAETANNVGDPRQVVDFVAIATPFKNWLVGLELAYGIDQNQSSVNPGTDAKWFTGQATAHHDFTRNFGTTLRYSFFNDKDGRPDIHTIQARTIHEITFAPVFHLSPEFLGYMGFGVIPNTQHLISGIDLRLEYRHDWTDEGLNKAYFRDADDNRQTDRNMFVAQLVASF